MAVPRTGEPPIDLERASALAARNPAPDDMAGLRRRRATRRRLCTSPIHFMVAEQIAILDLLAYVTVANVVRQLQEKGFLRQQNKQRPFVYAPERSFEEVSSRLVGHLLQRVFDGSRERMLVQVLGRRKLSASERRFLQDLLAKQEDSQ